MRKGDVGIVWALLPIVFLIAFLAVNVKLFGQDSSGGANQFALLCSGLVAAAIGMWRGISWDEIFGHISDNIAETIKAIFILLMIGALSGSWLVSGIIPTLVYYGLDILQPGFFLIATVFSCIIISLSTGSSWSTIATVGVALLTIGQLMGFSEGWTAGAIISGAYFGDKMSPLSDTTNLAPAMAGTDLITHIKYMIYTTVPTMLITLAIFAWYSWGMGGAAEATSILETQAALERIFFISPVLFLVPGIVLVLIALRIDAFLSLFLGTLFGLLAAVIFQPDILGHIIDLPSNATQFSVLLSSIFGSVQMESSNAMVSDLLSSGGMAGMLSTIWLILTAMFFSGALEGAGLLEVLKKKMLEWVSGPKSLVGSTIASCLFLNVTASDQYLAVIVPGKLFRKSYEEYDLAPENLSRTLEDSGTVTSVLVPWNTCGAVQSNVLGVDTLTYAGYCFFNIISPIMTFAFVLFKIRIKKLSETKSDLKTD